MSTSTHLNPQSRPNTSAIENELAEIRQRIEEVETFAHSIVSCPCTPPIIKGQSKSARKSEARGQRKKPQDQRFHPKGKVNGKVGQMKQEEDPESTESRQVDSVSSVKDGRSGSSKSNHTVTTSVRDGWGHGANSLWRTEERGSLGGGLSPIRTVPPWENDQRKLSERSSLTPSLEKRQKRGPRDARRPSPPWRPMHKQGSRRAQQSSPSMLYMPPAVTEQEVSHFSAPLQYSSPPTGAIPGHIWEKIAKLLMCVPPLSTDCPPDLTAEAYGETQPTVPTKNIGGLDRGKGEIPFNWSRKGGHRDWNVGRIRNMGYAGCGCQRGTADFRYRNGINRMEGFF